MTRRTGINGLVMRLHDCQSQNCQVNMNVTTRALMTMKAKIDHPILSWLRFVDVVVTGVKQGH